jgi:O-antigen/teichoic acid export membrane protein
MVRGCSMFVIAIVIFSAVPTFAADAGQDAPQPKLQITIPPEESRPAILLPLYIGFAALQVYDGYSTIRGVREGNRETNPLVAGFADRPAVLWSVKAATTALSIYLAEQDWRQHHRKRAIVTMVVANGVMGVVAALNASHLASRR